MADKIRLGFIGAGHMGQRAHIRNYSLLPDECELAALAELRPALAGKVAQRYGIPKVYRDHREMLADADIDAVVGIMYYGLHYTFVPDVLSAGKHLLTEKPVCCRAPLAKEWKRLADENGVVYLVGYMKRWDLGARHVRDLVCRWKESGEFGKLNFLRCNMSGTDWVWNAEPVISDGQRAAAIAGSPVEPFPEKFSKAEANWFNMNINFFVHQINLIRFLLDEDYDLSYVHRGGKILLGETESGVGLSLEMGLHHINQTWDEIYEISFEGADIRLSMPAPLHGQRNGEVVIRRNVGKDTFETVHPNIAPPSWSFFEQAKGFLASVRAGKAPHDSAGDAARDLEMFERQVELMRAVGGKTA